MSRKGSGMPKSRVVAFVMAGGEGMRLRPFTEDMPKPALPFTGGHRIIDFALSNLYNSSIRSVFVLLQYRPQSLLRHLAQNWAPADIKCCRRAPVSAATRSPIAGATR
jgi:ADP-glucose pyrophosphorylase